MPRTEHERMDEQFQMLRRLIGLLGLTFPLLLWIFSGFSGTAQRRNYFNPLRNNRRTISACGTPVFDACRASFLAMSTSSRIPTFFILLAIYCHLQNAKGGGVFKPSALKTLVDGDRLQRGFAAWLLPNKNGEFKCQKRE